LESEATSKNSTPSPDEKKATKAKSTSTAKRSHLTKEPSAAAKDKKVEEKESPAVVAAPSKPEATVQPGAPTDGANEKNADASRPRRTTRKSVRISEV